jgi:23S rRNA (guanosine2251-2'-O)-methyltransferase
VIGSEGDGLRRLVREKCDELVRIPSKGQVQSLNASVAAAILIHGAVSKRG